jgi:hypothetical protein
MLKMGAEGSLLMAMMQFVGQELARLGRACFLPLGFGGQARKTIRDS